MVEVPAGRGRQRGADGVACGVGLETNRRGSAAWRDASSPAARVEVQAPLRRVLTGEIGDDGMAAPSRAGRRGRREFVVVDARNRAMCCPGMAERHGVAAGGQHMNKTEMADRLAARTGLSKGAARDAVDGVFAIVGEALADGEEVRLPGFGTFGTRSRPARTGRNPRTGEAVSISAPTSATFRAGKTLKDAVNAGSA